MSKYERIARIDGMDLETGRFPMTLATEGEASDGHILSIKGGHIPERMPMLLSHWNDPTAQVGSVLEPSKHLKDSPPRLRAVGQIEMTGAGMPGDVRRDLALMIDKGHVNAVSVRWDEVPGKSTRRVNLPPNHPHYVDAESARGEEKWGVYFEEWTAREGSIVALGADQGALIGRAEQTEGEVSSFWRAMAEEAKPADDDSKVVALLASLRSESGQCIKSGASIADVINAVIADSGDANDGMRECRIGEHIVYLPNLIADQLEDELADREQERIELRSQPELDQEPEQEAMADQPAPINWDIGGIESTVDYDEFGRLLCDKLEEQETRIQRIVQEMLDMASGKVT